MYKIFSISILIIFLIFFTNCENHNKLLPDNWKIKEINKISLSNITEIYVYSIQNEISEYMNFENIAFNCQNNCEDCQKIKWTNFKNINLIEKRRILSIINEDSKGEVDTKELMNDQEKIYFAGCFSISKGKSNDKNKFYETMYILDLKNKKYYVFDYIGENY
jgi:hypothetical protein